MSAGHKPMSPTATRPVVDPWSPRKVGAAHRTQPAVARKGSRPVQPLVLPELVSPLSSTTQKPTRASAAPSRSPTTGQPATTAASVRHGAQQSLMEEWAPGSQSPTNRSPTNRPSSRDSAASSRGTSRGSVQSDSGRSARTAATPSGTQTTNLRSDSRKIHRRHQVAEVTRVRVATSVSPELVTRAERAVAAGTNTKDEQPAAPKPEREVAVGLIKGVPFVAQSGEFGSLVDQWISSSSKASSPKTRLQEAKQQQRTSLATGSDPRGPNTRRQTNGPRTTSADGPLTNTKVKKARQRARKVVDRITYAPPQPASGSTRAPTPHRR